MIAYWAKNSLWQLHQSLWEDLRLATCFISKLCVYFLMDIFDSVSRDIQNFDCTIKHVHSSIDSDMIWIVPWRMGFGEVSIATGQTLVRSQYSWNCITNVVLFTNIGHDTIIKLQRLYPCYVLSQFQIYFFIWKSNMAIL